MVQLSDFDVNLDRDAPIPLYQQLRNQIAQLIAARKLPPGARLPARRDLAEYLGVNRATIANAYDRLVADGLARSHVGQGTFVADASRPGTSTTGFRWPLSRAMEAVNRFGQPPKPRTEHPNPIDFASLVPDEELFPIEPFREALDAVVRRDAKQLLQYGPAAGY